jgi:hypothetical protein
LEAVEANPGTSMRRLAFQVGVSHHVVWCTLKNKALLLILGKRVEPEFLRVISFTEEATFTLAAKIFGFKSL